MTSPMGGQGVLAVLGNIIGAGVSAYGAYEGGVAGQAMQNYRARVAQINAGIAQEQATTEIQAGDVRAQVSGLRTGNQMALTTAGMAAGGLDIGSGSARQVLSSEQAIGQFEAGTIRNEAARRAYGFNVGAFEDTAQANVDIQAGKQLRTAGDIGVATSLLGGATQVSDKWQQYGQSFGSGNPATLYPDPNNPGGFAPGYL